MTILGFLISNPTLLAIMGGVVTVLVAFLKGNSRGALKERAKHEAEQAKARSIADQVDNDIGALPPDKARQELKRW